MALAKIASIPRSDPAEPDVGRLHARKRGLRSERQYSVVERLRCSPRPSARGPRICSGAGAPPPSSRAARASGAARQRCLQRGGGGGSTLSTTCGREGEGGWGGGATSMAPQPRPCGACRLLGAGRLVRGGTSPEPLSPRCGVRTLSRRDESWDKSNPAPPRTINRKDAVMWPVPASGGSRTERWEDERHGKRSRARSARGHGVVCAGERAAAARWQRPDGG